MNKEIIISILKFLVFPLILIYILYRIILKFLPVDYYKKSIPKRNNVISQQLANQIASELHNAMKNIGTDLNVINQYLIYIQKQPLIYNDISNAFGVRPYFAFGGFVAFGCVSLGEEYNLNEWLREELSDKDYKPWYELFINS